MKLVISTQVHERYGERWKPKFGSIYTVDGLTKENIRNIEENGIPHLEKLIEFSNEMCREEVAHIQIVPSITHVEDICGDEPIKLSYNHTLSRWIAKRHVKSHGGWQHGLLSKDEMWALLPNGERENYSCLYNCADGEARNDKDACEWSQKLIAEDDGDAVGRMMGRNE